MSSTPTVRRPRIERGDFWKGNLEKLTRDRLRLGIQPCPTQELINTLKTGLLHEYRQHVQVVKIYETPLRATGEPQCVIEIFIDSEPRARLGIESHQQELFQRTGWLIITRGEWLSTVRQANVVGRRFQGGPDGTLPVGGEPASIQPASEPQQNCFRLKLSTGRSLLLDLGSRADASIFEPSDCAAFLSHAHTDHIGALKLALARGLPVFTSRDTLRVLYGSGWIDGLNGTEKSNLYAIDPGTELEAIDLTISCERVPHSIGSVCWSFNGRNTSLLYTGDLMLRSRIYGLDWQRELERLVRSLSGRVTVLLEASRAHVAASADDEAVWPAPDNLPRDLVVVAGKNPERLLFSYVQLYRKLNAQKYETFVIMTGAARNLLESSFDAVYKADKKNPIVNFLKPENRWGFAESKALFWLDRVNIDELTKYKQRRVWFIDAEEIGHLPKMDNPVVFDIRTGDTSKAKLAPLNASEVIELRDRPAWTQHSFGGDVAAFAERVMQQGVQTLLFHARDENYIKFKERFGCEAPLLRVETKL